MSTPAVMTSVVALPVMMTFGIPVRSSDPGWITAGAPTTLRCSVKCSVGSGLTGLGDLAM